MATRSMILMEYPNGKVMSAYCHWDGYPSHNGSLLLKHYLTQRKVSKLLSEGNMSYLAPQCGGVKGHTFENPKKNQVVYYGRDRGETRQEPQIHATLAEYDANGQHEEYGYLFKAEEKAWYYQDHGSDWMPLTEKDCVD